MRRLGALLAGALGGATLVATGAEAAAVLPAGFAQEVVAEGVDGGTAMAFAPDGRLFITTQNGTVWISQNGARLPNPFITLNVDPSGERGLLGIAFDPAFGSNGYVYLYYTVPGSPPYNSISRFTAQGNTASLSSRVEVMRLPNLSSAQNHNGGAIHFGPDGKLYVAVGENANGANSQSLSTVLGKMLRINADGTIPGDNPLVGQTSGQNQAIWAMGLRNPYTFAFERQAPYGDGRMYINDVGQNEWEEIDPGIAGANYGWPVTEGAGGTGSGTPYVAPVYTYNHTTGSPTGCAITGGAFYSPLAPQFPPGFLGSYFFADFCGDANGSWIYRLDKTTGQAVPFASGGSSIVDLQVSDDGALYYLARSEDRVYRVEYVGNSAPGIVVPPDDLVVTVGDPATFSVVAYGSEPLSYQWFRNGVEIAGATGSTYTLATTTFADSGAQFTVRVSNSMGSVTSEPPATLTVSANRAPTATILTPAEGATYTAGTTVTYSGTGTDPEDGTVPVSTFTWQVDFHHDAHTHPVLPPHSGVEGGSFTIPPLGETSANVFYRITLSVVDSEGRVGTSTRDVLPVKAEVAVRTSPPGLQASLDGQPSASPITFEGVAGMTRTIGTTTPQTLDGRTWTFTGWSDGGALVHEITTPATDASYIAVFNTNASICPATAPTTFGDIANSFAGAEIACMAGLGLTAGTTSSTYSPSAPVTRGQMAVFLMGVWETLVGAPYGTDGLVFTDIAGHFAEADIVNLAHLGMTAGTGGGRYSPDGSVTREEMAVFLVRLWEASGQGVLPAGPGFSDMSGSFASDEAAALGAAGITAGCGQGRFCPGAVVTREQMAVFLVRVLDGAFVGLG